jgi:Ankyrin repeats (3 copies)
VVCFVEDLERARERNCERARARETLKSSVPYERESLTRSAHSALLSFHHSHEALVFTATMCTLAAQWTPLYYAIVANRVSVVKYLVHAKAALRKFSFWKPDSSQWSALQFAVAHDNLLLCKYLIRKGANVNEPPHIPPIVVASGRGNVDIVCTGWRAVVCGVLGWCLLCGRVDVECGDGNCRDKR